MMHAAGKLREAASARSLVRGSRRLRARRVLVLSYKKENLSLSLEDSPRARVTVIYARVRMRSIDRRIARFIIIATSRDTVVVAANFPPDESLGCTRNFSSTPLSRFACLCLLIRAP